MSGGLRDVHLSMMFEIDSCLDIPFAARFDTPRFQSRGGEFDLVGFSRLGVLVLLGWQRSW